MGPRFELTNYTFSILGLLAWTIFTIIQRLAKPLESNWPPLYWLAMTAVCAKWPDITWKLQYVMTGLGLALVLRFEFMNNMFTNVFRVLEMVVFGYVLYYGVQLLFM
jgi:hypothetical protein